MKNTYRKDSIEYALMLAPFLVLFVLFIFVPIIVSVILSFTDFNMVQAPRFVGLANYARMFLDDSVFVIAVRNTMIFALFTGPISYFACLIFAWLVNELTRGVRAVFTFLLYVPSLSGALYIVWAYILSGDRYGMLNSILTKMGLIDDPVLWLTDKKYILGAVIVVQLWLSLGTSFLAFIAGFKGIDIEQYEAGVMDGVGSRLQELWLITLPNMGPQLMFGAVMQIGACFASGAVGVQLLAAAGNSGGIATDYAATTIVTLITDMGSVRNEMGYACAMAVLLFALMTSFNSVIRKILVRFL